MYQQGVPILMVNGFGVLAKTRHTNNNICSKILFNLINKCKL